MKAKVLISVFILGLIQSLSAINKAPVPPPDTIVIKNKKNKTVYEFDNNVKLWIKLNDGRKLKGDWYFATDSTIYIDSTEVFLKDIKKLYVKNEKIEKKGKGLIAVGSFFLLIPIILFIIMFIIAANCTGWECLNVIVFFVLGVLSLVSTSPLIIFSLIKGIKLKSRGKKFTAKKWEFKRK